MNNARRPKGICVIPGCHNGAWVKRGLAICGEHARDVLLFMDDEVATRAKRIYEPELRMMRNTIRRQTQIIRELKEAAPPARATAPSEGVVYYLRSGAYIKIGWTSDLEKRMRAYAPDSLLLATEPGTRKDETRRHKMFSVHRTHGREWYAMVPSLMHHIDLLVAEHGIPDPVSFAAQPVGIPQPRPVEPIRPNGWRGAFTA